MASTGIKSPLAWLPVPGSVADVKLCVSNAMQLYLGRALCNGHPDFQRREAYRPGLFPFVPLLREDKDGQLSGTGQPHSHVRIWQLHEVLVLHVKHPTISLLLIDFVQHAVCKLYQMHRKCSLITQQMSLRSTSRADTGRHMRDIS